MKLFLVKLFNYKDFYNVVNFSNNDFDKVVNKLKELKISFRIFSKVDKLLSYDNKENFYLYYYNLSCEA